MFDVLLQSCIYLSLTFEHRISNHECKRCMLVRIYQSTPS